MKTKIFTVEGHSQVFATYEEASVFSQEAFQNQQYAKKVELLNSIAIITYDEEGCTMMVPHPDINDFLSRIVEELTSIVEMKKPEIKSWTLADNNP